MPQQSSATPVPLSSDYTWHPVSKRIHVVSKVGAILSSCQVTAKHLSPTPSVSTSPAVTSAQATLAPSISPNSSGPSLTSTSRPISISPAPAYSSHTAYSPISSYMNQLGTSEGTSSIWTGLDTGRIAVFNDETGALSRVLVVSPEKETLDDHRIYWVAPSPFCSNHVWSMDEHGEVTCWDVRDYRIVGKHPGTGVFTKSAHIITLPTPSRCECGQLGNLRKSCDPGASSSEALKRKVRSVSTGPMKPHCVDRPASTPPGGVQCIYCTYGERIDEKKQNYELWIGRSDKMIQIYHVEQNESLPLTLIEVGTVTLPDTVLCMSNLQNSEVRFICAFT